ncbi:hypothetical protein B6S12_05300 [Helicobacter valdiviensis]|uniref:Uncharacterized protein n=1 Tax=Helicobacter valdiviensis TaxID=1458358 RepID=A0A2W6MXZ6_9HELI|nr:hypothetical protein [Helicobacter valdiviensis]PZT48138.1 hypothetical protein B6S12_05300 [Helicobacter valdiviensis]
MQDNTQKSIEFIKIAGIGSEVLCLLAFFVGIAWSFIFGVLLGLASVVSFLAAIYGVAKHSSAKGLFVNFFAIIFIVIMMSIGGFSEIEFYLEPAIPDLKPKRSPLEPAICGITFLCAFVCAIFIPLKNLHYELSRVTFQKIFVYAFWCVIVGILFLVFVILIENETTALVLLCVVLVLMLFSLIYYLIAFVRLNRLSCGLVKDIQKYQNYGGNLTLIKIFFVLMGFYYLCVELFMILDLFEKFPTFEFVGYFGYVALIMGLMACILLSKNTKNWLLTFYFVIWMIVSLLGMMIFMIFDVINFYVDSSVNRIIDGIFNVVSSIFLFLFAVRLNKIANVEFFKISSFIEAGCILSLIVVMFVDAQYVIYSFMDYMSLMFCVFFILGALMMKKDKMSF